MKNKIIRHVIAFLVLVLITSCASPSPQPTKEQEEEPGTSFTLAFRDSTCDYEGPARVFAGAVKLKIVIEEGNDEAMNGVAVVAVTLQPGKTIEDLQAWPIMDKPPWADIVEFRELFPTPMEKEFPITLRKGPIYFVCFFPDSKIGAHGPLEVVPDDNQAVKPVETFAPRVSPTNSPNPAPIVIDTDMALDDWLAILYLLNRTDVDVKGITVTGAGEAHCEPGVRNALKLVKLADKENIPIACGSEKPLVGDHAFPKEWRDFVDAFAGQDLPEAKNPFNGGDATALLQQIISNSPKKVTLLTLGPLTNIAALLREDGQIAKKIQMVYIMGGAVEVSGNVSYSISGNNAAEFNIFVDPAAASEVLSSGVPVTLIPLDATNQVPLNLEFYEHLEVDHPEQEAGFAYDVLATRLDSIQSGGYYFWDPLAAAILVDESLSSIKEMPICVDTSEGNTSGATKNEPGCPKVRVAMTVDQERFEYDFLETLNAP